VAKGRRKRRTTQEFFSPYSCSWIKKVVLIKRTTSSSATGRCGSLPWQEGLKSAGSKSHLCALAATLLGKERVSLQQLGVDQQFTMNAQHVNKYRYYGGAADLSPPLRPAWPLLCDNSAVSYAQLSR